MAQKIIAFAIIAMIIFPVIVAKRSSFQTPLVKKSYVSTETETTKVKVVRTAYYKPSPHQKFFLAGSYKREIKMNGKGKTYSGLEARTDLVAADLKIFPLGTVLHIPGHGVVTVADKGEKIKGKKIDVFVGEGEEGLARAIELGKKEVEIEVLKKGGQ